MKLEKYLVLNKYFLNLFGLSDFNELREKLKDVAEGYDYTGRSYFVDVLIGLKPDREAELLRYDTAIRHYVEKLKQNRKQPNFNLKYFQYLAIFFTEMFLDRIFNDKERFLNELNDFLENFKNQEETDIKSFTEEDLKKLAFWMATGSGKTLIMHVNYWQILKYSKNNWDNIILITPNEGLSKQHYEELRLSGIPCKLYDGNINNLKTKNKEILIIDIYKLAEEKRGEGVSVDISYFDGKNLVFIDEGHKGQKTEEQKWKKLREEIGKNGFLFEYSATFGQVIGNNKDLLEEYAKAIIFDYSYKYFYTDGYGKDFYVYNIKEDAYTETHRDLLLTAGLLSFYEQLVVFEKYGDELRGYNIEKPLWIFVGSKVTGKGINSDVVRVIQFLDKIIKDENYLKENIKNILEGKSGLIDNEGNDIFKGKFEFIRGFEINSLVENIYQKVFGGKGRLELYEIKNAEGEIGLKLSTTEKYFGVINVGNTADLLFYFRPEKIGEKLSKAKKDADQEELKTALEYIKRNPNLIPKEDHFSQSLFFGINESSSHINVLIGSKKFVEGWNSWRVSNMCLINMGRGEGPQIIQLFGRGVRLKGKDYSLKRETNPDYYLKVLQTIFIFGLNADYINAFLSAIEKEEVDYKEIKIPLKFNEPQKWEGVIYTVKVRDDYNFLNHIFMLKLDDGILGNINIDLRPRITLAHGLETGIAMTKSDESVEIPLEYFHIVNWDELYTEISNYKVEKGMSNLILDLETLKQILTSRKYKIFIDKMTGLITENENGRPRLKIDTFDGIMKFQEILLLVAKEYVDKFYKKEEKKESMNHLEARPFTINDHPYMFPENQEIVLKIPKELSSEISEIIKQLQNYDPTNNRIPTEWGNWDSSSIIHFDRHLYTPLIIWKKGKEKIESFPTKLNKGETDFLRHFREFLRNEGKMLSGYEIFLLRNLSRRGIGFFLNAGFYPDFIIWVNSTNKQHLIFVDPKGIRNTGNFNDDKIQFCVNFIKDINQKVCQDLKNKQQNLNLQLDAFILSVSPYNSIKKTFGNGNHTLKEFEDNKVFFQEDPDYIKKIFRKAGILNNP